MTFFSQWEHLNFSIAKIYGRILFIGQGSGHCHIRRFFNITVNVSFFVRKYNQTFAICWGITVWRDSALFVLVECKIFTLKVEDDSPIWVTWFYCNCDCRNFKYIEWFATLKCFCCFQSLIMSHLKLEQLFRRCDTHGKGYIDHHEFRWNF